MNREGWTTEQSVAFDGLMSALRNAEAKLVPLPAAELDAFKKAVYGAGQEYPKEVNGQVVQNKDEHDALLKTSMGSAPKKTKKR